MLKFYDRNYFMATAKPSSVEFNEGDKTSSKRLANPLLAKYYSIGVESHVHQEQRSSREMEVYNPYDVNSQDFNSDLYLNKLLKEYSLPQLMEKREAFSSEITTLDNDMKTLVYENYNKFISATDTIRKIKTDFCQMEDEMDRLATNMAAITNFSGKISNTLQDRRQNINKLSNTHSLLKKLQFLFELPAKLNKCMEAGSYSQVVRYYLKAQQVLNQYQHMPSFQGIRLDCDAIVVKLKEKLREQFQDKDAEPEQLSKSVHLLLQLREPTESLCDEYLAHARQKLDLDLTELHYQVQLLSGEATPVSDRPSDAYPNMPLDILAFVDLGCNQFLSNICLVVASYQEMFINSNLISKSSDDESLEGITTRKLFNFVNGLMQLYFFHVEKRVSLESAGDCTMLVRALDRFHRRLLTMNNLLPESNFVKKGTEIVSRAAHEQCVNHLKSLQLKFNECLTDIRQSLASGRNTASQDDKLNLAILLQDLTKFVQEHLKISLSHLQAFIQMDVTFAIKPSFRERFCKLDVREGLVAAFFRFVNSHAGEFFSSPVEKGLVAPTVLLLLSRLCLDFEGRIISEMIILTEKQFPVQNLSGATSAITLSQETKEVAQRLLNHYVQIQGLAVSQMLRKSVETRDWLNTIEPRTVRAVMKRVVEDVTAIDIQVGHLYEEGSRRDRSSDSSRRAFSLSVSRRTPRSNWNSYAPSTLDDSLLSNIHKLFSERIEIFSAVEFSKVAILTGIIKISLKTFIECVRLRTFGKYGLQQIQVDTHYLQMYLWRFVSDENLVHFLLEEILSSTIHRCLEPTLMEQSVVEVICERS